jgi:calcineurin-like phosphoesterase family protein
VIYFTSDPHYYHSRVIEYCARPFNSVEMMNEKMVANWNNVVHPDDVVYCLGDFSLAYRPVELYTNRLVGQKRLIPGNHDWCHPANKKARGERLATQIANYEREGWEVLPIHNTIDFPELGVVNLCHMPYQGDTTDARYQEFRMVDDGKVLICGHVHEKWKIKFTPNGTLMVNVGVDVCNFTPVSIDNLKELIDEIG